MDNEMFKIDKLIDGSQWLIWKFQLRQILEASEMYDVVNGDSERPDDKDANYATKIVEWKKVDAKARRTITTTLGRQPLLQIMNCETANAMWTTLKSIYEQSTKSSLLFLQQKYYGFSKDPNDDMATYYSKLMEIVQQLKDHNEIISDSMIIAKLLMSLPTEYNHFYSAWESTAADQQTLQNLRTRLLTEELRAKSQDHVESVEALLTKSGKSFNKSNKNHQGSQSNKINNNVSQSSKEMNKSSNSKRRGKCYGCGKSGHYRRDCPEKKNKVENKQQDDNAFMCQAADSVNDRDAWVLDSGASDHMSHRREWFINYKEISMNVMVGNGSVIAAEGRGDINILAYNGVDWIKRHIADVLFVPEISMNLFSSGKVMDRGFQLRSNNKRCDILNDDEIVAVGVRREKLFQMFFKVIPPTNNKVSANVAVKQTTLQSWHERLGHQNVSHVKSFLKRNKIRFIDENFKCEACIYGKHHRGSYKLRQEKSSTCGEIVFADVCGPMQVNSIGGSRYFLLLKDDYSHFRFVYFMKQKSEVTNIIKNFVMRMEREKKHNIRVLRSDNGTEFVNAELKQFFDKMGIEHQKTVPYTPEQNGCAEREMRTIVESARTMIYAKDMDLMFWAEAVNFAVYVLNCTGTSSVVDQTPYDLWHEKTANVDRFRVFGCDVFVHIPKEKRRKWDAKAMKYIFVGYDVNAKAYRVWNSETGKIEIARDVVFLLEESSASFKLDDIDNEIHQIESCSLDIDQDVEEVSKSGEIKDGSTICNLNPVNIIDSRLRNRNESGNSNNFTAMMAVSEEPKTYQQAIESVDHKQWELAMDEEYDSLIKNNTWRLVKPPSNQKVIDNRWVYKLKYNTNGELERFKARLVVRGFTQEYGIDYNETFSPVVRFSSVRAILALAASRKMKLKQIDVKTAFLNGVLDEDVYMCQPIGYNDNSGRVCKLLKSLYGLKQASRCWNKKFTQFISKFCFRQCDSDGCVFVRTNDQGLTILAIYVDDGLLVSDCEQDINLVIEYLSNEFEVKVFEAHCFVGLEIRQNSDCSIHINQASYAKKIINRFGFESCGSVSTPADPSQNLGDFVENDEKVVFPYREVVGSLMYLCVGTRPDISFAVGNVSRYLEHPAVAHVNAVKRILKFIKGTFDKGILFNSETEMHLIGYSDADFAGDSCTRRSTSGYVFLLGGGTISWGSERQKSVALSSTESEYMAASHAIKELVWLNNLLSELLATKLKKPVFYMDNQSAIRLVKNPEFHKRTKHIDVRYHFIREKFQDGIFELQYIPTDEQCADIMTKALPKEKFLRFLNMLNILSIN